MERYGMDDSDDDDGPAGSTTPARWRGFVWWAIQELNFRIKASEAAVRGFVRDRRTLVANAVQRRWWVSARAVGGW